MSFVFKKGHTYFWPVTYSLPEDGKHKSTQFQVQFTFKKHSEIQELIKGEGATDEAFCKAVVLGWKDVNDEVGQAVEFSDAALAEFVEIPQMAKTIVTAYLESLAGAKTKN